MIHMLTTEDVVNIHNVLIADFANSPDPISPPGLRSRDLLESAISRQTTGLEGRLKYDSPVVNAASLAYGICSNHPFFNGNKRVSLVALLCHLDKNHLTFDGADQSELYDFMLKVAKHGFVSRRNGNDESDTEVQEMARWIKRRTRKIEKGERVVTFRELAAILRQHGFEIHGKKDNFADLIRTATKREWFGLRKRTVSERVMKIPYPNDGQVVGKGLLREIRKRCQLSDEDGFDSEAFYTTSRPADYFVARYRGVLRRLARV